MAVDRLYIMQQRGTRLFKFGVSKDPKRRRATLQTGNAARIDLLFDEPCGVVSAYRAERAIHEHLAADRVSGEWFRIDSDDRVVGLAQTMRVALRTMEIPTAPTAPPSRVCGGGEPALRPLLEERAVPDVAENAPGKRSARPPAV